MTMTGDVPQWKAWRRAQRRSLIEVRKALSEADRRERDTRIDHWLATGFGAAGGHDVGFCWPFAAEPEPRFAVRRWREAGSRAALPAVVAPRTPLQFRQWWPGAPMEAGVYDIPYPVDTALIHPAVVLVPVNGLDDGGFRLGYGGGYFDRTLAALDPRPITIGIGYETARIPTIHPRAHDIPLDFFVSEAGIRARTGDGVAFVEPDDANQRLERRLQDVDGLSARAATACSPHRPTPRRPPVDPSSRSVPATAARARR